MDIQKQGNEYTINYDFMCKNSEILVNDIVIDQSLYGNLGGMEFINQFILQSGKQSVKLRMIHPFAEKGGEYPFEVLEEYGKDFNIFQTVYNKSGDIVDMKIIKNLSLSKIKMATPIVEREWSFEAELPFELEGWKNSEDLSKWDKNELEKKVVNKYKYLRELLNQGNGSEFIRELSLANQEYFDANYISLSEQEKYIENLIDLFNGLKGKASEISDYKMRILGEGKVVVLEKLSGKFSQKGILSVEDKENKKFYSIYVMLHKKKTSDDFEIIRMQAFTTALIE
ncbi:hypothetical protein [Tenacibaculum sp. SDUM215027]|uniref:hypothetical protein n=1 Tax=Tenacibaculum sp. SDUM215027 TaxID=3422596 RepID=UPI003D31ABFD